MGRESFLRKSENANKGITLVALIITIIILLILAGVTILTLTGENGILGKSKTAKEETDEKAATEIMNLKITNAQIKSYSEEQQMPNLQYLANRLCEDNDIQYVELTTQGKKQANTHETILPYINVPERSSIFTKLKEYPYEFEIDGKLRLASINGIQVAEKDYTITITEEELNAKIEAKVNEKINVILDAKVDERINEKLSFYQKLRSDEYEEVAFIQDSLYTAPCDGYYCCRIDNQQNTSAYNSFIFHYTKSGTLISTSPSPGYNWGTAGCEIYMKKGEYLRFKKENSIITSSKFFYAEGCKPDTN